MHINDIARIAHQVNKAYCESIGDSSQVDWEDAPDWQKSSAVDGVRLHIRHPETTAAESHESWLKFKLGQGWKYGPIKDVAKLEHPCIVPYDDLPEEQRVKDRLFKAVISSLSPCKLN